MNSILLLAIVFQLITFTKSLPTKPKQQQPSNKAMQHEPVPQQKSKQIKSENPQLNKREFGLGGFGGFGGFGGLGGFDGFGGCGGFGACGGYPFFINDFVAANNEQFSEFNQAAGTNAAVFNNFEEANAAQANSNSFVSDYNAVI